MLCPNFAKSSHSLITNLNCAATIWALFSWQRHARQHKIAQHNRQQISLTAILFALLVCVPTTYVLIYAGIPLIRWIGILTVNTNTVVEQQNHNNSVHLALCQIHFRTPNTIEAALSNCCNIYVHSISCVSYTRMYWHIYMYMQYGGWYSEFWLV